MFTITVNVDSADAARIASDTLEFLAEMLDGQQSQEPAAPRAPRQPRKPRQPRQATPAATDPAAMYEALGGTLPAPDTEQPAPAATESPAPATEPPAEQPAPAATTDRPALVEAARKAAMAAGGIWYREWIKAAGVGDVPLSGLPDDKLADLAAAAQAEVASRATSVQVPA